MLRVENPKHEKNEVLRMVEFQRSETGKERSSSNGRVPKERDWKRTKFFEGWGTGCWITWRIEAMEETTQSRTKRAGG